MLNDATKYEEIALTEALQFTEQMFKFYSGNLPADFKQVYCQHFSDIKNRKFTNWKKYICTHCDNLELNGQLAWDDHIKTRKHEVNVRNAKKRKTGMSDREFYMEKNKLKAQKKAQKKAEKRDLAYDKDDEASNDEVTSDRIEAPETRDDVDDIAESIEIDGTAYQLITTSTQVYGMIRQTEDPTYLFDNSKHKEQYGALGDFVIKHV